MGEQGVLEQRGRSASGLSVAFTSSAAAAGRTDMGALDTPLTSISIFKDMTWLGGAEGHKTDSRKGRESRQEKGQVDRDNRKQVVGD